jgi:hypothetical protein
MKDIFRPSNKPAQILYDAWGDETEKRQDKEYEEWVEGEREVMLQTANSIAEEYGLKPITMEQVKEAEYRAYGHVGYGAKWVYGILDKMRHTD